MFRLVSWAMLGLGSNTQAINFKFVWVCGEASSPYGV